MRYATSLSLFLFCFGCDGDKDTAGEETGTTPRCEVVSPQPCDLHCWNVLDGGYFEYAYQCESSAADSDCIDAWKTYIGGEVQDQICAQCNRDQAMGYVEIRAEICGLDE